MELIQAFRVFEFLEHRQIYLTGLSMGGMGVWEVAAQRPERFAALLPFAALHKKENEVKIAQSLSNTPVFAVHDRTDTTCQFDQEAHLWDLIKGYGNQDVTTSVTNGINCKRFAQSAGPL
jgi:predicted peptidase